MSDFASTSGYPFDLSHEAEDKLRKAAAASINEGQQLNESADLLRQLREAGKWALDAEVMKRDDPSLGHLRSMISSISYDTDRIIEHQQSMEPYIGGITSGAGTAASTGVSSIFRSISGHFEPIPPPVLSNLQRSLDARLQEINHQSKLDRIDPALAPVYMQARQQLLVPGPDAGRAAIQQIRSLWDNFFDVLAPKESVTEFLGLPPEADVTRRKRLEYAIERWIAPSLRLTLTQNIAAHLSAYNELNRLHKRGSLINETELANASEVLFILHQWIDAVRI